MLTAITLKYWEVIKQTEEQKDPLFKKQPWSYLHEEKKRTNLKENTEEKNDLSLVHLTLGDESKVSLEKMLGNTCL